MNRENFLHGKPSKSAIKTTENLKKKGLKAVRVDSKTVIFVKSDKSEKEAIEDYNKRLMDINADLFPSKWVNLVKKSHK